MPTVVTSNLPEVLARLSRFEDAFALDQNGSGEDMLELFAQSIAYRFGSEEGDEGRWDENRGKYGERKRAFGIPVGVGMKKGGRPSGAMRAYDNIRGVQTIEADEATMRFGVDDFSRRKGMWFQNGSEEGEDGTERSGARNQPRRDFYGITEDDADQALRLYGERVAEFLAGL
jgi:hypothetical protein